MAWRDRYFNPAAPGAIGGTTPAAGAFTTLSASGDATFSANVGVGTAPAGWSIRGLQVNSTSVGDGGGSDGYFTANAYFASGSWKYINAAAAAQMYSSGDGWVWRAAGSDSANGAITWSNIGFLNASGNFTITGSTATKASGTAWANPSDVRLKDNIQDYGKGLAELMQVRVRTWDYNGKGGFSAGTKGLGVVADEIMAVLPDAVSEYCAKLNPDDSDDTAIKKVDATEVTWLLVKALQELKAEFDAYRAAHP